MRDTERLRYPELKMFSDDQLLQVLAVPDVSGDLLFEIADEAVRRINVTLAKKRDRLKRLPDSSQH